MSPSTLLDALKRWALPFYRIPSILRASVYLRSCGQVGRQVRLLGTGRLRIIGAARIRIADGVWFNEGPLRTSLECGPEGTLSIGVGTGFNYGVSLRAHRAIQIGRDCMFGAMVMVRDSDGQRSAPVVIGDRVWIAHGALIEPGVTIGDDAVISAGSVVVEAVPARTLAVGNPARCLPLLALRRPSNQGPEAPGAAQK